MNKLTLSMRSCKFGAPMGHSNQLPENIYLPIKLQMEKLKWIDGDYICDGTYFGGGSGDYIYCAFSDNVRIFVRAKDRIEAKELVRDLVPNARFYN
jgi:hypothetical protein